MSKRICVLGNSHVAALKDGWTNETKVHADFFGCLKEGMASFGDIDGKLGPLDPNAAAFFKSIATTGDFVEPADYDAFVLTGMKFFPNCLFRNYADFATPSTHNHDVARNFVSDATMVDAVWGELNDGMMLHTARTLRAKTDAPIFIVWQSFLSEGLRDIEWRDALYAPIVSNNDGAYVHAIMAQIDQRLVAEGFQVLSQPEDTIEAGVMTKREYSEGSKQFREGGGPEHRALDVFHMNERFGTLCWQTWFADSELAEAVQ
ncbi:hypothetical protein [Planktotalea sp.]|uniref:hypothetical protein n=1 Tax=Planktotalea sp. TaxID=2029877 RepID=UPI003297D97A